MKGGARWAIWGVVIWAVGFIWGGIVLGMPSLASVPGLPWVSSNLAISVPLLAVFPWLARRLAPRCASVGRRPVMVGAGFAATSFLLDLLVLGVVLGQFEVFGTLGVWLAYAGLIWGAAGARAAAGNPS